MTPSLESVIRGWKRVGLNRRQIEAVVTACLIGGPVELVPAIDMVLERDRLHIDSRMIRLAFKEATGVLLSPAAMRAKPSDFRALFLEAIRRHPPAGFLGSALAAFLQFHPEAAEGYRRNILQWVNSRDEQAALMAHKMVGLLRNVPVAVLDRMLVATMSADEGARIAALMGLSGQASRSPPSRAARRWFLESHVRERAKALLDDPDHGVRIAARDLGKALRKLAREGRT